MNKEEVVRKALATMGSAEIKMRLSMIHPGTDFPDVEVSVQATAAEKLFVSLSGAKILVSENVFDDGAVKKGVDFLKDRLEAFRKALDIPPYGKKYSDWGLVPLSPPFTFFLPLNSCMEGLVVEWIVEASESTDWLEIHAEGRRWVPGGEGTGDAHCCLCQAGSGEFLPAIADAIKETGRPAEALGFMKENLRAALIERPDV